MAERIKSELGLDVDIAPGRTASFEVTHDGTLLFSKLDKGRFPTEEEIITKLG